MTYSNQLFITLLIAGGDFPTLTLPSQVKPVKKIAPRLHFMEMMDVSKFIALRVITPFGVTTFPWRERGWRSWGLWNLPGCLSSWGGKGTTR